MCVCAVADDDSSDSSADDTQIGIDWVPIGLVGAYAITIFTANMIENVRKGKACFLVRLGIICKNQIREAKLHRALSLKAATGLEDLEDNAREVFDMLKAEGKDVVPSVEVERLVALIVQEAAADQIAQDDLRQIKNFVVEIFNISVRDLITPGMYGCMAVCAW